MAHLRQTDIKVLGEKGDPNAAQKLAIIGTVCPKCNRQLLCAFTKWDAGGAQLVYVYQHICPNEQCDYRERHQRSIDTINEVIPSCPLCEGKGRPDQKDS